MRNVRIPLIALALIVGIGAASAQVDHYPYVGSSTAPIQKPAQHNNPREIYGLYQGSPNIHLSHQKDHHHE
jgi:hypothetical protein